MADVQCENGYTKIANELLEAITRANFSSRELKTILALIRYSFGYSKKSAVLSLRFLSEITNIEFANLSRTLKHLERKNIIKILSINGKGREIQIVKDYESWNLEGVVKLTTVVKTTTQVLSKQQHLSCQNNNNIKKTIKKNLNKETDSFFINLIPESLIKREGFIHVWKEWIEYRKSIKKKLTEFSVKKQLKFLELEPNPIEVINQSIRNQWQGLFPLKSNSNSYRETKNEINDRPKILELKT